MEGANYSCKRKAFYSRPTCARVHAYQGNSNFREVYAVIETQIAKINFGRWDPFLISSRPAEAFTRRVSEIRLDAAEGDDSVCGIIYTGKRLSVHAIAGRFENRS